MGCIALHVYAVNIIIRKIVTTILGWIWGTVKEQNKLALNLCLTTGSNSIVAERKTWGWQQYT